MRLQERYPDTVCLQLTDNTDRRWALNGRALTTMPWVYVPNSIGFNSLCEWTCDGVNMTGMKGHGEVMDFIELPLLNALNSAPATLRPSRPL